MFYIVTQKLYFIFIFYEQLKFLFYSNLLQRHLWTKFYQLKCLTYNFIILGIQIIVTRSIPKLVAHHQIVCIDMAGDLEET